jgi:hypothetical protein
VLARMEALGVCCDPGPLQRHHTNIRARLAALAQRAEQLVGHPVNLSSSSQVAVVLYEELQLPVPTGAGEGWGNGVGEGLCVCTCPRSHGGCAWGVVVDQGRRVESVWGGTTGVHAAQGKARNSRPCTPGACCRLAQRVPCCSSLANDLVTSSMAQMRRPCVHAPTKEACLCVLSVPQAAATLPRRTTPQTKPPCSSWQPCTSCLGWCWSTAAS